MALIQLTAMVNGISFSGKKLAKLRREKWFSQEKLAREIGISKTRMSAIETADRAGMYMDNFKKMAEVLGVNPDDLVKRLKPDDDGQSYMRVAAKPVGPRGPRPKKSG